MESNNLDQSISLYNDPTMYNNIVAELRTTERVYVESLHSIIHGYIPEIRASRNIPSELSYNKRDVIFRNIDSIYLWHKNVILPALEASLYPDGTSYNITAFCRALQNDKHQMDAYIVYCGNYPLAEYLVVKFSDFFMAIKDRLGHSVSLCDLLIKPIQRIAKYKLLLLQIIRSFDSLDLQEGRRLELQEINMALVSVEILLDGADRMMISKKLENCPRNPLNLGKLLLCDIFECTTIKPNKKKKKTTQDKIKIKKQCIYFFDTCILLTDINGGKKSNFFVFKDQIEVKHLVFENLREQSCNKWTFSLKCSKSGKTIICRSNFDKHREWVQKIEKFQQNRNDFIQILINPVANKPSGIVQ